MAATLNSTGVLYGDSTQQNTAFLGFRSQIFTATGTFTVPTGVTAVKVTVVGGGGGTHIGYGNNAPGAGAGVATKFLTGLVPAGTLTITVGAAGTNGSGGARGGTGGTSSVASGTSNTITTISAAGGEGTLIGAASGVALGGIATNGDINLRGTLVSSAIFQLTNSSQQNIAGQAIGYSSPATLVLNISGCCFLYSGYGGTGYGYGGLRISGVTYSAGQGVVIIEW